HRPASRLRARVLAAGPGEPPLPAHGPGRGAGPGPAPRSLPGPGRPRAPLPQLRGRGLPPGALRTTAGRPGGAGSPRVEGHHARRMGRPDSCPKRGARVRRGERVNLADLVRDAALANPDKPALVFQGRGITFGELDDLVDLTAGALTRFGVER